MAESLDGTPTPTNRFRPVEALSLRQSRSPQGTRLVEATGEVDLRTAGRFEQALLEGPDEPVVVDLTRVTFFDSSGAEALVEARRQRSARSVSLVISETVARVLHAGGLLGEFTCFESVAAAAHEIDATLVAWPLGV